MKIKVLLFGLLSEITGRSHFEAEGISTTDELRKKIENDFPKIKNHKYLMAVNQEIARDNVSLKEGDEVALLPPFAGG